MIISSKYKCSVCDKEVEIDKFFSEISFVFVYNGSDYNSNKGNFCSDCSARIVETMLPLFEGMGGKNNA